MRRRDRWYLVGLCSYATLCFLPVFRGPQLAGVSLFGWLMAGLMVLSPLVALALFWSERETSDSSAPAKNTPEPTDPKSPPAEPR